MSKVRTTERRVTRGAMASLVIGLYAVLLAAGPLEHHDLACHLKSRTHCTTCVYASVAGDDAGGGRIASPLPVVTDVEADVAERVPTGAPQVPADRAPPA